MMEKTMMLEIFRGGGVLERELLYTGKTLEEIAGAIERDENELLYFMSTGDDKGQKSFCFQGFMFRKDGIDAAQISEPVI
jgi:hypothetical protein